MRPTEKKAGRLPLKRAIRALKRRTVMYRRMLLLTTVGILALGLAFILVATERPDPVLLGQGPAGILELHDTDEPLPEEDIDAETESLPQHLQPGQPAGEGAASFYGDEFAGRPTASGERFHPGQMTAAHRTLPLGSVVRVTNLRNNRSVVVRINDRGPFHGNRVIDLSKGAARELGFVQSGTAPVRIELLPRG